MKPKWFLCCLTVCAAWAQQFEVASVKPAAPQPAGHFSWHTGQNHGHYIATNATLRMLLQQAYQIKDYQLAGPSWLENERYDVDAKAPEGTPAKDIWVMLQNLLVERFRIALHKETKDLPVHYLIVGKGGHKMKESAPEPEPPEASEPKPPQIPPGPPPAIQKDRDGYPIVTRGNGLWSTSSGGIVKCTVLAESMTNFTRWLTNVVGHPVIDRTGLTGKYDFRLEYAGSGWTLPFPRPMPSAPPPPADETSDPGGPTIFGALPKQLGLQLEAGKAPGEIVVIDKVEKTPTEN